MNGNLGGYFTLLPDQMSFLNAAFVLIVILIYESAIFPLLGKFFRLTPLRKMSAGGLIAGASFVIAGLVQVIVF
jgi:dipeptide/tripeptide permease